MADDEDDDLDDLDELEWVVFDPDDPPSVLTTPNLCALFGGCKNCPGWASVAATGLAPDYPNQDELVFCKHHCHKVPIKSGRPAQ